MHNVIDNLVLNNDDKNLKGFKSQKQTATYGKTKMPIFTLKLKIVLYIIKRNTILKQN